MFDARRPYPSGVQRPRPLVVAAIAAIAAAAGAGAALSAAGDLSIASLGAAGAQGAAAAEAGAVSADGRFVAFTSSADLTGVPAGGVAQLYVCDRVAGTTVLASSSAAGAAADGPIDVQDVNDVRFAISGDGRYVVFASPATNLAPADTDATRDVFRKDLVTGAVALVSVSSTGAKANAAVAGDPDVSYDGSRVSFGSGSATNLFAPDGTNGSDIVVRDIAAGTTVLAAVDNAGVQANGVTERSAISADGRVVAFEAPAGTVSLSPADTGGSNDVYVRNLSAGATTAASDPAQATGSSFPDISGDGRYVAFETGFKYDATNDLAAGNDAYRRDLGTGAIVLVSARDGLDAGGGAGGIRPSISADGTRVTFTSTSTDLTTDANSAVSDVFVRDVATTTTRLVSIGANGTAQGLNPSERSAVAANGGVAAFVFTDGGATRLVPADTNLQPDVHLKELTATDASGPALALAGPADGTSQRLVQVAVAGTTSDPSGISSLTVNDAPLALTATGGFSTSALLSLGPNTITVRSIDGAGNATTRSATVTRVAAPALKRILGLSASLVRGRVVVKLRLSAQARVRVRVLRRLVGPRPSRTVVLRGIGAPVTRVLAAGAHTLRLKPPSTTAGRYVVRVRILGGAGAAATRTDGFRIPPRR